MLHARLDESHTRIVSLEAALKAPIPTSCSTCEMHALKNMELAHYVDRLQDENDELRKLMSWLSGHEPQLSLMLAEFKRFDGQALGAGKSGEKSGEGEEKVGETPTPPHTIPMNKYAPKPNHLRNKLDTTPDPPVFPHKTENYQKPIKFVSNLGNVFEGKSGEKAVEKPQPKPQPIRFHCQYYRRDGHKDEFCFRRKRDERFAREMANKDRYHPSHGVPEPRRGPLPRGEVYVRTVPTRGGGGGFPQRDRRVGFGRGCNIPDV